MNFSVDGVEGVACFDLEKATKQIAMTKTATNAVRRIAYFMGGTFLVLSCADDLIQSIYHDPS